MLLFEIRNGEVVISDTTDKTEHGIVRAFFIRPGNDNFYKPVLLKAVSACYAEGLQKIKWVEEGGEVYAALTLEHGEGVLAGSFDAEGSGCGIIRLVWEAPQGVYFPFVPGFMYGYNKGGGSRWAAYPQLIDSAAGGFDRPWQTEEWLVRTDRSTHGFSALIGEKGAYAIGGRDTFKLDDLKDAGKTGIGMSNTSLHRISFSIGFCNVPYTYSVIPGRNFLGRPEAYADFSKGKAHTDIFFLIEKCNFKRSGEYSDKCSEILAGASGLMRKSYSLQHDEVSYSGSVEEAAEAIAGALAEYGYCKEAKNFFVTMSYNPGTAGAGYMDGLFNTAWAGGLRSAWPLLEAGLRFDRQDWTDIASSVFDNISNNALSSASGLFFENFDPVSEKWNTRGWWYRMLENPGHSGYINGQACYYLLLAYMFLREKGIEREQWLHAAGDVLGRAIATQNDGGGFGYTYSETDGSILDGDGFSGCWFTPALALYYELTGDTEYLSAAEKAMRYYRSFVTEFNVYGGPHDVFKSPDEEGVLAFIKAAHILHRYTGKLEFLYDLKAGLEYEFSWKFTYNAVPELEPLRSRKWCATGGSVTSVNNSHIHPMGSSILGSIAYAVKATDDVYFLQRYEDTLKWTLTAYLHYDGDYDWGKKGLINERFCYTDSLLAERYPDGSPASTWFCAHSWASGAVLEGLMEVLGEEAGSKSFSHLQTWPLEKERH